MKKRISVATNYYLLKPHVISSEHYDYYYVRIENELMPERKVWMQGYINSFGGISTVGPPLLDELSNELEKEYEEEIANEIPQKKPVLEKTFINNDDLNEWWNNNNVDIITINSYKTSFSDMRITVVYYHQNLEK